MYIQQKISDVFYLYVPIYKCFETCNISESRYIIIIVLYKALNGSKLEYAQLVWNNFTLTD
jgi:hypothetical protein